MNSILKELFCIYRSSFRCIKFWIVIYYKGRKYPQIVVVLLPLESDAAFTTLNGHSARKIAVLVVVWSYKATGEKEHLCLGTDRLKTALRSGMTTLKLTIASVRSMGWGEGEMKQWRCCILYLGQSLRHAEWKHNTWNFLILTTGHNIHWRSR
jgi:hypothetical protein